MLKIVIFGGTKYIGKSLVEFLKLTPYKVYVFCRVEKQEENINFIRCDRRNEEKVKRYLLTIMPDVIIDMICFTKNDMQIVLNSLNQLTQLKHYIMVSTFHVYNFMNERETQFNKDTCEIEDDYTRNKIEAENQLCKSNIYKKSTIVRFPFVFSHDDYSGRFQKLIKMTENDKPQIDTFCCSLISKEDASKFLLYAIRSKPLGFVDVSNANCISFIEILKLIASTYNRNIEVTNGVNKIYPLKRDICLNSAKIGKLKGIEESILNEVEKFRDSNGN